MILTFILNVLRFYLNAVNALSSKWGGKQAFLIFCYPFATKLKKHQLAFLKAARTQDYSFEGKNIATYQWGNGATHVLMLHGWQSNSYRWKKFAETLDTTKYTLTALDAPAHGLSAGKILNVPIYAKMLEHYVDAHKVDFILAHSLGAFSVLCLLFEKPTAPIKKVALLGTPGEATDFIETYAQTLGTHASVKSNLVSYFKSYSGLEPSYYSTLKFTKNLSTPALIIHDVDDKEAPYHYAQAIVSQWPNATLFTTEGLGHKLRSIEVVHAVQDFFEQ